MIMRIKSNMQNKRQIQFRGKQLSTSISPIKSNLSVVSAGIINPKEVHYLARKNYSTREEENQEHIK